MPQQRVALRRKRAEEIADLERQLTAVAADDRTLAEILRGQIVEGCENDAGLSDDDVAVPFGDNPADLDIPADFTCSCCGESFTSTLRQELPHDQDSGYGHCLACFPATAQAA